MKKIIEKSIAGLFGAFMLVLCAWMFQEDVQAAVGEADYHNSGVVYVERSLNYVNQRFGKQDEVPTYSDSKCSSGYLFGGWYTKVEEDGVSKYKPIKDDTDLAKTTTYFTKHVPAYVLSVRCQNKLGTKAVGNEDGKTKMRYIAGLDSTNYAEAGFIVHGVSFDGTYKPGSYTGEGENKTYVAPCYTNTEKNLVKAKEAGRPNVTTVYRNIFVYKTNEAGEREGFKRPAHVVFGEGTNYMMTYLLSVSEVNFARTYSIQPYWKTFDGVMVKGLTKYAHVEDGINKYVNVPINLTSTDEVAAGKITVDFTELANNGYTFMEAECGTVFPEKVVKKVGNTIQCVATVVNDHAESPVENKASDNIYINLRFKRTENKGNGYDNRYFVNLPVSDVQFAKITDDPNTPEAIVEDYKVWDVRF